MFCLVGVNHIFLFINKKDILHVYEMFIPVYNFQYNLYNYLTSL